MVLRQINLIIEIDDGVIQDYNIINVNDVRLNDPEVQRICTDKKISKCPHCLYDSEIILYFTGISGSVDYLEEQDEQKIEEEEAQILWRTNDVEIESIVPKNETEREEISKDLETRPKSSLREQKYQEALIRGDHCCNLCDKKFKNSAALIAHKKTCTGLDIHCELCGDQFESRKKLSKHFNVAHNKMNHVCFVCGTAFKQKWLLEEHIARHSDARPFKCDICKSAFSSKETLKIHIHSKHLPTFVGYKCNMCDKSYATNSKLKRHMKSRHHVAGTFICGSCSVAFGTEGALDKHIRNMHTPMDQKTRYKCSLCPHMSTSQLRLQEHELGHSDASKWPFSCATCGKRFVQKHSLERHQTIHTGVKPFSCENCGQSFRLSYQLKAHMQTHQPDLKPFQCRYCSKSYRDRGSFNKHVETHYVKNEEENENMQE